MKAAWVQVSIFQKYGMEEKSDTYRATRRSRATKRSRDSQEGPEM